MPDGATNAPLTDEFGPEGPSVWTLWTRLVRLDERTASQGRCLDDVARRVMELSTSIESAQRAMRHTAYLVVTMAAATFVGLLGMAVNLLRIRGG